MNQDSGNIHVALKDLLAALERRFDDLREADRSAVRLAHEDLSRRLEGFPQQFATREEMKAVSAVVAKLDKDSVARELYEQNHTALARLVTKLEQEKLPRETFDNALNDWTIWRNTINAAGIASMARSEGSVTTWKTLAAVITIVATIMTVAIALIVLLINNAI